MSHRIIGTTGVARIGELEDVDTTGAATNHIYQYNSSGKLVNRPPVGTETSNTPVAGANDTVPGTTNRMYTFLTMPTSAPFFLPTGFEVLNGTVVNGSWQCGCESVDANLPVSANTTLWAYSSAVAQSGVSAIQRIGPQRVSGMLIPSGHIVGIFLVSNSATGRYGTTTVASGNRTRAIALGTMNTTATNAWVAGTEEPYVKMYYKPVLGI